MSERQQEKIMVKKLSRFTWLSFVSFIALAFLLVACGSTGTTTGSSGTTNPIATATSQPGSSTPTSSAATTPVSSKPTVPLTAIRMLNANEGWALTASSVLKTTDGGVHWQDVTPTNAGLNKYAMGQFMNAQYAWVAIGPANQEEGAGIRVLRTSDGGTHWQQSTIHDAVVSIVDVPHFINANQGWIEASSTPGAGSAKSDIWASSDGGQTWTQLSSNKTSNGLNLGYVTGISFRDAQFGIAAGNLGAGGDNSVPSIAITQNGGRTWQTRSLPHLLGGYVNPLNNSQPPVFFGNVVFLPVNVTVSNGNLLVLYRSNDGGVNWVQTSVAHIQATNTYVLDTTHAWATDTSSGELYSTSDGGNHWSQVSNIAYHLNALSFPDAQNGWGVTSNQLLHTTDGGRSWQQINYSIQ